MRPILYLSLNLEVDRDGTPQIRFQVNFVMRFQGDRMVIIGLLQVLQ